MPTQRLVITLPTAPAPRPDDDGAGSCSPSGPYLAQSMYGVPEGSQYLHLFGIYGLSPEDVVEWISDLGRTTTSLAKLIVISSQ